MLDLSAISLQILLPLLLIAWAAYFPAQSRFGLIVQVLGTLLVLLALLLAAVWIIPPWWVPYAFIVLLAGAVFWNSRRADYPDRWLPQDWRGRFLAALVGALGIWSITVTVDALHGREPPPDALIIDLEFPLGLGDYLVANGGASEIVNGHFLTLTPKTDRQRAYRGQSYGVDLIKIDKWGLRAASWRPSDPANYAIFGEQVFAPCDGEVLRAADGMPDMQVPNTDTRRPEGNHVFLKCGNEAVLLAHLRKGSVRVAVGQALRAGERVGEAGNSGQSTEPHLHIHIQELPSTGSVFAGEPIHVKLDGRFPIRNKRLRVKNNP